MARGYQGAQGDVKALAMKKWFNTNYHYMVPEIEDDTTISLAGNKLVDEYLEAKENGFETKPVIAGPFTLLSVKKGLGILQDSFARHIVNWLGNWKRQGLRGFSLMNPILYMI